MRAIQISRATGKIGTRTGCRRGWGGCGCGCTLAPRARVCVCTRSKSTWLPQSRTHNQLLVHTCLRSTNVSNPKGVNRINARARTCVCASWCVFVCEPTHKHAQSCTPAHSQAIAADDMSIHMLQITLPAGYKTPRGGDDVMCELWLFGRCAGFILDS